MAKRAGEDERGKGREPATLRKTLATQGWWSLSLKRLQRKLASRSWLEMGGYDSKDNFRTLDDMKIEPVIKVRSNSIVSGECTARDNSVLEQLSNYKRWKTKHGYGMRWTAESCFSSIKRTFGESIKSVKWENMVNELLLKGVDIQRLHANEEVRESKTSNENVHLFSYSTEQY